MSPKEKENLIKAAHAGGEVLRKYFGRTMSMVIKSTVWDYQTEADLGSEKAILEILKKGFPEYNIHSEEEGKLENGSDYTIVVDPLDGTNNFVIGIPNFCVSIAVLNKNEAVAGVVYQPILDQTYFAEKGKGAFLNDKRIRVSEITESGKATVGYTCGYKSKRNHVAGFLKAMIENEHKRILFSWSPANDYCLLASGKIESVITDLGLEIYDYAAGKLIAKEAGAKIISFDGTEETNYRNDRFIASNNDIVNKHVLGIIKEIK